MAKKTPKRRGRNEGTVRWREDLGRWEGRVSVGGAQRSAYATTKVELQRKMAALAGAPVRAAKATGLTLEDFASSWLDDVAQTRRPGTTSQYAGILRKWVLPRWGGLVLSKVDRSVVLRILGEAKASGASLRLQQAMHATLGTMLQSAVEYGHIERNPQRDVRRPGGATQARVKGDDAVRYWTTSEVKAVLSAARGLDEEAGGAYPREALLGVLVGTGLRLGEALGLRWSDVDLDAATLTVVRQCSEVDGVVTFAPPKTARARRTIGLGADVVALLGRLRPSKPRPEQLVFASRDGAPFRQSNIRQRVMRPVIERAGVPRRSIHEVRHTHATLLLQKGVAPHVVSQRLGHKDIRTTLGIYAHVLPSMDDEAAKVMTDLLQ
jgi:integrase